MVSSPCISVCIIDGPTNLCLGCGRTLPEIARWGRMSEDERLATMATLSARMKAAGVEPPSPPRLPEGTP